MRNKITLFFLFLLVVMALLACSQEVERKYDIVNRVDVYEQLEGETSEVSWMITDQKKVDEIIGIFGEITWVEGITISENNPIDMTLKFFYEIDSNMPERLVDYELKFRSVDHSATIFDRENDRFGIIDSKTTLGLKELIRE